MRLSRAQGFLCALICGTLVEFLVYLIFFERDDLSFFNVSCAVPIALLIAGLLLTIPRRVRRMGVGFLMGAIVVLAVFIAVFAYVGMTLG